MPIRQGDVARATKTVTVEFSIGTLELRCRELDGMTYARLVAATEGVSEREGFDVIVDLLARVIEAWDYLDDTGEPLPVTRENLLTLPVGMIVRIAEAVMQTFRADRGE
jgi:hypothetical protein